MFHNVLSGLACAVVVDASISKSRMKVFIAIIPQDYSSAQAELCLSKEEADCFIQEWAIRGETHYCSIQEAEITMNDTFHAGWLAGLAEARQLCVDFEQSKSEYLSRLENTINDLKKTDPEQLKTP